MNDMIDPPAGLLHPLTRYRQRHGLSMDAFAKLAGTTGATISRIESGSREPTLSLLRKIVDATGRQVSADQIMNFHTDRQ